MIMENVTAETFGKRCIVVVKDNPSVIHDMYDMHLFNFTADAINKKDNIELKNITISVPDGFLDPNKCTKGTKLELTLTQNSDGTYGIGPKITYLQ